ncbi:Heat shock protein SSB [Orchesella cincta]|uniref:Heat shock protein SSB n=1 Tax=Orchesella cincta TaxID=48709 RepID=A0A1D2MC03_ORCCI|nr:Heat shock protein SSB [Orchesella cincta]
MKKKNIIHTERLLNKIFLAASQGKIMGDDTQIQTGKSGRWDVCKEAVAFLRQKLTEALDELGLIELVNGNNESVLHLPFCEEENVLLEMINERKRLVISERCPDGKDVDLISMLEAGSLAFLTSVLERNQINLGQASEWINKILQDLAGKYKKELQRFLKINATVTMEESTIGLYCWEGKKKIFEDKHMEIHQQSKEMSLRKLQDRFFSAGAMELKFAKIELFDKLLSTYNRISLEETDSQSDHELILKQCLTRFTEDHESGVDWQQFEDLKQRLEQEIQNEFLAIAEKWGVDNFLLKSRMELEQISRKGVREANTLEDLEATWTEAKKSAEKNFNAKFQHLSQDYQNHILTQLTTLLQMLWQEVEVLYAEKVALKERENEAEVTRAKCEVITGRAIPQIIPLNPKQSLLVVDFGVEQLTIFVVGESKTPSYMSCIGCLELLRNMMEYCIKEFINNESISLDILQSDTANAKHLRRRVLDSCEKAVPSFSNPKISEIRISVPNFFSGKDLVVTITRQKFEELNENIDKVLLIGGFSQLPQIQNIVTNYFGNKFVNIPGVAPDEVLAYCTAVEGAFLAAKDIRKNLFIESSI